MLASLLLFGNLVGLFPDARTMKLRGRTQLSEAIALSFASQATQADEATVHRILTAVCQRNPDLVSIGVRRATGDLLTATEEHESHWNPRPDGKATLTSVSVPLGSKSGQWGTVEFAYKPLSESAVAVLAGLPPIAITGCICLCSFCIFGVYLRFALRALNPSKVIPKRVNEALNTLAEGLLVLDKDERIVLANDSFASASGIDSKDLLGRKVSELPWQARDENDSPWSRSLAEGSSETGVLLELERDEVEGRTYSVNSVPILDDKGNRRGVLASFEDVTEMERKNEQMSRMLDKLRKSAKQVNRQNRELERLATRDPLTNCLNRRAFFEQADQTLRASERYDYPISCMMLDVDHFKSVNDHHGHAMGDEVLQHVGLTLLKESRESDLVCRYGGEEFGVLMPHVDIEGAEVFAERLRVAVAALEFEGLSVTASFGVTDRSFGATDIQAMLDQADQSLYAAKKTGRNRVTRFDTLDSLSIPEGDDQNARGDQSSSEQEAAPVEEQVAIPYRAVTALLAALAFRDRATAEHSRRVAELSVMLSEDLVSRRCCYVIEMAALLHDIGKVGVPDSILLKPGRLTKEEWKIMEKHDQIGSEIVRSSFASRELSTIIESHHLFYAGTPRNADAAKEMEIPLGARILTIADAYDAMTSDRVYSKGRPREEAFAELRRCAGTQFDPELVELFIRKLSMREAYERKPNGVSKQAALGIGLQIERLVSALDDRDLKRLKHLNAELNYIAAEHDIHEVVAKSDDLASKLDMEREDLIDILCTAGELLELCRRTQDSFLDGSEFRKPVGEPETV